MVSALILAAGRSSRMGELKPLLPLGRATVIEHIIDVLLASRVEETIVVLGHRADEIERLLRSYPIAFVRNPDEHGDMMSSIQCGVRTARNGNAVMVVLADQPLITTSMVNELVDAHEANEDGFIIPVFEEKRGHPMIIGGCFRDEVLKTQSKNGLKGLRDRYSHSVHCIPVDSASMIADMDYREEYEQILAMMAENNS